MKFIGTKLKMDQIWQDVAAMGVTPVKMNADADLSSLKVGDLVKVSGITRGLGFQGVVKRHGFHGGPKTHGQKNRHRAPGSIGNTTPQRVIPGRRMPGHMGVRRVTIKNLTIVDIKPEEKVVLLKGSIPGHDGKKVEIRK